jgi:L-glyceraldehyde 3-phosphate reductase
MQVSSDRYSKITYNRAGKSGVQLPLISLGCWHNFGTNESFKNMREMVAFSFNHGIVHFDLANNYGPPAGAAEINFGKIMQMDLKSYRDELLISTKAGYGMWAGPFGDWGSKKYLIASCDQSLVRLGLSYVDIFYHHRYDPKTALEETTSALAQLVHQGKALYVGLSNYPKEPLKQAVKLLREQNVPIVLGQYPYNMMDTRFETDGVKDMLDELAVGSIVFSPLAQGLLTDRYFNGIPEDSRIKKGTGFLKEERLTPKLKEQLFQLNKVAEKRGQNLAQMAVAWLVNKNVTSVLIGASKVEQIEDNLDALNHTQFTKEELRIISDILKND